MPRKLVLYIACSVDGFIAAPGDDLSFLNTVAAENEDYGYHDFMSKVDTIIMGRKTYDKVVEMVGSYPNAHIESYIITRQQIADNGLTRFYAGDIEKLVVELKEKSGGVIYCDGGAELVNTLLKLNLIDEIIMSVIPVLLGAGIRLFGEGLSQKNLQLQNSRAYESGLVQLTYTLKN